MEVWSNGSLTLGCVCERARAGGHFQAAGAWTNAQALTGQETRAPEVRGDRASAQGAVKIMVDTWGKCHAARTQNKHGRTLWKMLPVAVAAAVVVVVVAVAVNVAVAVVRARRTSWAS